MEKETPIQITKDLGKIIGLIILLAVVGWLLFIQAWMCAEQDSGSLNCLIINFSFASLFFGSIPLILITLYFILKKYEIPWKKILLSKIGIRIEIILAIILIIFVLNKITPL